MGTFLGFSAVLMWSLLALLTARSGAVPPFQLAAMTFVIATLVGLVAMKARGTGMAVFRQPLAVWILGVGGLFGYHALYFAALRNAPTAEASLIAYLWPLFIVLGSAMLPGERLRWFHAAGAFLGLAGAALIVTGGGAIAFSPDYVFGYALAGLCALTWSSYSLLSRRFGTVPSDVVTGFCAGTAVLSLIAHLIFEATVWPQTSGEWLAVLLLGLLPVGGAFYVWDHGVKHGNIQIIGASSYAAPLLSTLVLVAAGEAALTGAIVAAAVLITLGACLAALPLFRRLLPN
ncbi:EamA family transporter [Aurantimonas sp. C2-6-R+9]|uniref:aromatic amino acid exporter YddG n=1 Tax=unclassified Aurantimonas TaxID=2638230 RepID=UPI002E176B26|nr:MULTISPECIES: EamA family transporter [unclassified Aurantimonas]MEC5291435.1 EamA family transporter [Aurantimonas sp. C2-3-R2]MEC5324254.1 EamA family transporter [Aurantimonas sp. A3-2-R12]MEC5381699.1 EamA family transporter [Aurantimonas sp. C2-6-R+9]MEC5412523.1 EamA family transporter [Aurantimonas sp. C2-4-R8]